VWDVVLLDLMLPGLNGLDVLDALHRSRPELPVLILSARGDLPTKLRGFDLGASDYVSKPVAGSSGCSTTSSCTPAK
jgi:two-component system alkaline phosphatase synthesis response regulator PhoP